MRCRLSAEKVRFRLSAKKFSEIFESSLKMPILANEMKRQFDKEDVDKGLEHAGFMLDRLRTSSLNPTQYNELFMSVTNELRQLEMYLNELINANALEVGSQLYEKVQYNPNIIPRVRVSMEVLVFIFFLIFSWKSCKSLLDDHSRRVNAQVSARVDDGGA